MIERSCSVDGCGAPVKALGLCNKHWKRQRLGKPPAEKSWYEKSIAERFWEKVDKRGAEECWKWQAGTRGNGAHRYGRFWTGKRFVSAHRFSYELANGHIPETVDPRDNGVCHRCDNPLCVNPGHLYLGTHADNMRDTKIRNRRRKTTCKRGHDMTPENTYVSRTGARDCRKCHSERQRAHRANIIDNQRRA